MLHETFNLQMYVYTYVVLYTYSQIEGGFRSIDPPPPYTAIGGGIVTTTTRGLLFNPTIPHHGGEQTHQPTGTG